MYYDETEGRFEPSGYIHPKCAKSYFGTNDVVDRLQHFSPALESKEIDELRTELENPEDAASS